MSNLVSSTNEITPTMSIMAGSISGLIVRFVVAPLDIVKIRLQLHSDAEKYKSVSSTIRSIWKNEGIKAFWKGNLPAELLYVVYGGIQFTAFTTISNFTDKMEQNLNLDLNKFKTFKNIFIGALAGCTATCASYPLDLLRTRLASNDSKGFKSMINVIKSIYLKNGITGFFTGSLVGVNYVALSTGLSFGSYSYIIDCYENQYLNFLNPIINSTGGITSTAGISAGIISKTLVYPLDLIKRRLQMGWGYNWKTTLKSIIKNDGLTGLYRGLIPAVLKSAPATGVSLICYEFFINILKNYKI
jgi:solute carrier family 25 thiamine pyrophosphate transporter 19